MQFRIYISQSKIESLFSVKKSYFVFRKLFTLSYFIAISCNPMRYETYILWLYTKLTVISKCMIYLFVRIIPTYLITFCLLLQGRTIQDVGTRLLRNVAAHLLNSPPRDIREARTIFVKVFSHYWHIVFRSELCMALRCCSMREGWFRYTISELILEKWMLVADVAKNLKLEGKRNINANKHRTLLQQLSFILNCNSQLLC